jgi:hypothetical protein
MQILILSCQSRGDTVDRPCYHEQPHHRKNKDREQRAHFFRSRHVSTQNPKDTKTEKKKLPDPENWMTPTKKRKPKPNPKEIKTKAQRKLNLG